MSDMVQKLIGAAGNVILSLESGGTSAADSAGARANLVVPMRPKLLWSGSWVSGSITVPGFSGYLYLIAQTNSGALGGVPWLMYSSGGDYRVYGGQTTASSAFVGGRYGYVDGDTLSIVGSTINNITEIYGLVRKDDIQGVTA